MIILLRACMIIVGISSLRLNKQAAQSMLFQMAHQDFSLPGEPAFPLASHVSAPQNKAEEGNGWLVHLSGFTRWYKMLKD